MTDIGQRVGAIASADEKTVHFFGYGTYQGDFEHPDLGFPNPKIMLDSGRAVWGCECWWGPEEKVKAFIGDREIMVKLP